MKQVFFTVLGMSGTGALVILAVLLARLLLRRAPKIFSYALWTVVLLRLLCPFSLESAFGLLPAVEVRPQGSAPSNLVEVDLDHGRVTVTVDNTIEFPLVRELEPDAAASVPPGNEGITPEAPAPGAPEVVKVRAYLTWWAALTVVWLAGLCLLLGYGGISLLRLRRQLVGWVPLEGEKNVRVADHIPSPFVLGVFRPKIYLPSGLRSGERDYILLHERTHIRRGDHIFRVLAWLAVAVHWFNPLVWLAFHLAGKDMEMSCDEAVLGKMGRDVRADYSSSLLRLSQGGRLPAGPLAFGDGDPQSRIKNVLRWKKPTLWVMAAALIAVVCAGVALATAPGASSGPGKPMDFIYHEPGPAEIWVDSIIIEEMAWDEYREIQLDEYPGVTFRLYPGKLTAVRDGDEVTLFDGMPIENAYLCDLDGDGGREICSQVCIGSGIGDERIRVIRWLYESGSFSLLELEDRMTHDYYLGQVGDQLTVEERDFVSGARTRYGRLILTEDGLDIRSDGGAGEAPDLPAAELTFTLNTAGEEHSVFIRGRVGDVELGQDTFWSPPHLFPEYPCGWLSMTYPAFADGGYINAGWTDESRTSVMVSTRMSASLSSQFNVGWWEFTVDLDSGTVTGMEGKSFREGLPEGETRFYPASISDEEAVKAARVAAKLLTAGEDYWNNTRGAASPSPSPELPALDGLTLSQGWNDAIDIGGLDAEYLCWYAPDHLYFGKPDFFGPAFAGRLIYGNVSWINDKRTLMRVSLDVEGVSTDFSVNLEEGLVMRDAIDIGLSDGELVTMARTCAQLIDKAADYKEALDGLPPEEGIMPFGRPLELDFSSGAGAWRTMLRIDPDGSFVGDYSDTDMGDQGEGYPYGTRYVCQFHGRFRDVAQVTDASWALVLDELVIDTSHPLGERWIEEGVLYVSSGPYGFTRLVGEEQSVPLEPGAQFMLYSPEAEGYAPGDELYGMTRDHYDSVMGQFWTWWPGKHAWGPYGDTLDCWGLCNMENGYGFFSG